MGQAAEDLINFEMGLETTPYGHSLWNEAPSWMDNSENKKLPITKGSKEYYDDNLPKLKGTYTKRFSDPRPRAGLISKLAPWRIVREWEYVRQRDGETVYCLKYARNSRKNRALLINLYNHLNK
jgi:hypothetical protein